MAAADLQAPRVSASNPAMSNGSRPSSQSGYRFGQLSRSSFFTRHNPHPHRCIHIKGLLGLPIPVVVDDCDHSSYETHLCFPPNGHNDQKLLTQRLLLPVNAINLNSQRRPLDTVNGLQYFTSLRNYSFKEKAVPRLGLVPMTESWREQLRSLTEQTFHPEMLAAAAATTARVDPGLRREVTYPAGGGGSGTAAGPDAQKPASTSRPMYSQQTGRLIPPPSRAMSRRPLRSSSHRGTPASALAHFEHISAAPDLESAVFSMLCQILQTEDFNAVQAWLVSASDRERAMVMDVIRSAVANRAVYYEADPMAAPSDPVNIRDDLRLPPIAEASGGETKRVDRLVIEDAEPEELPEPPPPPQQQQQPQATPEMKSQHPDAKPAAGAKTSRQVAEQKPRKQLPGGAPSKAAAADKSKKAAVGPKLKYSKTEPSMAQTGSGKEVWRPNDSYAK